MIHRLLLAFLCGVAFALPAQAQQAQLLQDPQWRSWYATGRHADLERAALARLAQQPGDAPAVAALALTAEEFGDARRLQQALDAANACIASKPEAAPCHFARGSVLGLQAVQGGGLTAVRLAGDVRAALAKALELDPQFFEARHGLVQFYLAVPSIAGGSVEKARELAAGALPRQPEQAKLLRAMVALKEDRLADAERELASIRAGDDISLLHDQRELKAQLANSHFRAKRLAQARALYESLQREAPALAMPVYGLARVATDEGRLDDAIRLFERARTLDGARRLPVDHRLGQALIAKGDKAQAKLVLERFVASAKERWVNPRNIDDAKKLLAELAQ